MLDRKMLINARAILLITAGSFCVSTAVLPPAEEGGRRAEGRLQTASRVEEGNGRQAGGRDGQERLSVALGEATEELAPRPGERS